MFGERKLNTSVTVWLDEKDQVCVWCPQLIGYYSHAKQILRQFMEQMGCDNCPAQNTILLYPQIINGVLNERNLPMLICKPKVNFRRQCVEYMKKQIADDLSCL